ncbi:MAG: histidine--tRNA ligase [Ktedonobacteraceae bacterium]
MPEQFRALQGFKDILPEEQPYWRFIENTATHVAELYGYRRIETPLIEETSVFRKTAGEGTDIVDKEMYNFDDKPDKEGNSLNIAVRPEGTAGVVRAYLEHGMFKQPLPVKLYYISAPMFRHDKPQAGRYREHHQFGCEALGESDPAVDAEMIGLLYQFYTQLGLKHIRVNINSIGDGNCRPHYIEVLKAYYEPLLASCCNDCKVRFYKNPLRLLDCKQPQDQPKIANAPKIADYLDDACKEHFEAVKRYLDMYGVPYAIDPLLVRGLDYYTRTVFEFTNESNKTALNGGGRYDGLAEILGGEPTPGIGFGMGMERTILELKRQNIAPPAELAPQVFVAYLARTAELKDATVQLVAELRRAGIKAEMSYGDRSFKAQMKRAGSSNAEYAIVIGDNELANGSVTIRHADVEAVEIKRDAVIAYLIGDDGK